MNEEQIRAVIEQIDPKGEMKQGLQEELIMALKNVEIPVEKENNLSRITEEDLKAQIATEPDWRKRASMAARIISLGLDT